MREPAIGDRAEIGSLATRVGAIPGIRGNVKIAAPPSFSPIPMFPP